MTFYQTNGTHMDLSGIPKPFLTNVTAQSMVGVAPVANGTKTLIPWGTLGQLTSLPNTDSAGQSGQYSNVQSGVLYLCSFLSECSVNDLIQFRFEVSLDPS